MLLALLFVHLASATDTLECTTCIKVNETCFNISYLFDINAPFRKKIVITKLGILRSSNTLFYSFEPEIKDPEYYKVGFVDLDNPDNGSVISGGKQAMNFGTFDIDQDNSLVYLGGSDGVFVLDTKQNRVSPYSSRGDMVLSLMYKTHVYFIRDGEFKIVKKKGDNFDTLLDYTPIKKFVINKYNVVIFLSNYGLFATKQEDIVLLSKNPFIRGLAIDLDDVVYAWWIDGIYKVIVEKPLSLSRMVKVADVPLIGGLTFDNDNNFLFTSGRSVYRLIETNTTDC